LRLRCGWRGDIRERRLVGLGEPMDADARASASSESLCRAGEKHEVQQHVKMEDDEN
jgi:hypothetical protein